MPLSASILVKMRLQWGMAFAILNNAPDESVGSQNEMKHRIFLIIP